MRRKVSESIHLKRNKIGRHVTKDTLHSCFGYKRYGASPRAPHLLYPKQELDLGSQMAAKPSAAAANAHASFVALIPRAVDAGKLHESWLKVPHHEMSSAQRAALLNAVKG